jgi:TolA-binding protein
LLDRFQNFQAGTLRPEVFYWQGRAWLGRSEQPGSADVDRDARRAGLAFMRVALHYPMHALASESLFRAGELCRRGGRSDVAANLWQELVQMYPADRVWGERARREMLKVSSRPAAGSSRRQ